MSPPYHPPIYEVPRCPSDHLKVVLDYFEKLKKWDFDELSKLSTPNFTQQTLPASLGVATRTKSEDIAFLHDFRDALKGAPLEVNTQNWVFFSPELMTEFEKKIVLYEVLEEKGRIWVHVRAPPLIPFRGHH
jgi:hypothetical protein